jgi:signal transduction histidine kinase
MALSLRGRIWLTLAPLLVLLAALGGAGVVLLQRLGGRADLILRENYDSVRAMYRLNEALERIDSAYQFALSGRDADARRQYADNWPRYDEQVRVEQENITLPGEAELVDRLLTLTREYRRRGDEFFAQPDAAGRSADYYGTAGRPGLLDLFGKLKSVSGDILRINQQNMEDAAREARRAARDSLAGFGIGVAVAGLLAAVAAWQLLRAVLTPIRELTDAATAIGAGQVHRTVPQFGQNELGRLAAAFNTMSEHLLHYRRSSADRLLRAQRTGQATIDSFPDPILVVDPEGRVELANPAARQVLGVIAEGEAGWQPPESLRQPLAAALRQQQPFLTATFDQAVFFRLGSEDHAYLPQIRPIRDPYGGTLGAAVVLTDVTRFRLLDEVKSNLVATVSHELKTPLTSLRLALHLLLEEAVGPLEPKQIELLVDARDNAERLLRTIEHLLALARLEQGREEISVQSTPPLELLRAAADEAAPRAEARHLRLKVEESADLPPVAVDPVRLGAALNNLVDNAISFTEPGGAVTLSASADGDGKVRLTVADTGVGIPTEFLPHVFERFFRVPGVDRPGGTGLGLAIVREVVQAHGGEVAVESQPGRGTKFHVIVPVWEKS